ncbi:hypothetical protein PAXINDRAFT_168244 [Paxillus involutus ATCC 200175]|nr:hypothetical protein PAXINDRAFT_168244 [Paxillus involutus ATCC 200175]
MISNNLRWSSLAILATGLFSIGPTRVVAQTSDAVCLSSFNWMDNSKGQNPCLITAYLQGACNGGQFQVDALPSGSFYVGPTAAEQNPCQCSTVTYATISACALCQNQTYTSWSSWDFNCTTVYPLVFPVDIPSGTAIPAWAYQNVVTSDLFNATLAETTGDNPESTATHVQSTGSAVTSTSAVSASLTGSPSVIATPTSTSSSSKSNTGAIAGGVVGGVIALAAIVGVISYLALKKKRSRVAPSAQFADPAAAASYNQSMHTNPFTPSSTETQQRLYDPSDPSTFPTSPSSPTMLTTPSHNYQSSLSYPGQTGRPGGYSGAPEV